MFFKVLVILNNAFCLSKLKENRHIRVMALEQCCQGNHAQFGKIPESGLHFDTGFLWDLFTIKVSSSFRAPDSASHLLSVLGRDLYIYE